MKFYLPFLYLLVSSCTWVKYEEGAENIALVKPAHIESCEKLGEVSAQVKHTVSGLKRKPEKVARELIVLAKNQAVTMGANALVSLDAPDAGQQSFVAYRCEQQN